MARTLEQITREMLGSYAFQVAQLSAQLEAAKEQIATLQQQLAEAQSKPRLALVNEQEQAG